MGALGEQSPRATRFASTEFVSDPAYGAEDCPTSADFDSRLAASVEETSASDADQPVDRNAEHPSNVAIASGVREFFTRSDVLGPSWRLKHQESSAQGLFLFSNNKDLYPSSPVSKIAPGRRMSFDTLNVFGMEVPLQPHGDGFRQ